MVVAEFLFIAFVVGILTKTWLGFLGTFFGLFALYRFPRISAVLSLALSIYWGLLGYHLGAATGELGVGPLLAVLGFVLGAGVHREGFLKLVPARESAAPSESGVREAGLEGYPEAHVAGPFAHGDEGEIIDAEYRVIS